MSASNSRKRPVVQTTGIKIGLTVAAIGASVAGWAAMGIAQQDTTTSVAQANSNSQTQSNDTVVVPPVTDVVPAPLPQDNNTYQQPSTFGRPMARTRSSR